MNKKQKRMLARIILTAVLVFLFNFLSVQGPSRLALYLAAYFIIGYDILKKAGKDIWNRQVFDENFLMAVATAGAFALAIYTRSGDYTEAIAVMLFYQIGKLFQSYAVGKSRKNTRALTNESLPKEIQAGETIISGGIHMTGVRKSRTTKEFGEAAASKLLDLVENASSRKSRSEDFISKFARIYTPAVCCAALALALLPPLTQMLFLGMPPAWSTWIYRALTFAVISCPCALVISTPLTFFAGIGGASKAGVLIKGSNYMETLSNVKYVVFDKTGTLTRGVFEVNAVHHNRMSQEKLLEYAALAESASSHPISKSIQRAYRGKIDRSRVSDIQEISGHGVIAKVDGIQVAAGNNKLMRRLGLEVIPCHRAGTIIHMAVDGIYAGHIVLSDVVKEHSKEAIRALKSAGVKETVMLTGDARRAAEAVASELGVEQVYSELLPADKVSKVEALMEQKQGKEKLAVVGDGINDASVLSRADIGIAMGADAAIGAADIVLMDDDPLKIAKAIHLSRKCLRIVYQNIIFALAVKFVCLVLGAAGIFNMWTAIFADVGVMILAVLNAMRVLFCPQNMDCPEQAEPQIITTTRCEADWAMDYFKNWWMFY